MVALLQKWIFDFPLFQSNFQSIVCLVKKLWTPRLGFFTQFFSISTNLNSGLFHLHKKSFFVAPSIRWSIRIKGCKSFNTRKSPSSFQEAKRNEKLKDFFSAHRGNVLGVRHSIIRLKNTMRQRWWVLFICKLCIDALFCCLNIQEAKTCWDIKRFFEWSQRNQLGLKHEIRRPKL